MTSPATKLDKLHILVRIEISKSSAPWTSMNANGHDIL